MKVRRRRLQTATSGLQAISPSIRHPESPFNAIPEGPYRMIRITVPNPPNRGILPPYLGIRRRSLWEERPMSDDRRTFERYPAFQMVEITSVDRDGNENTIPLILRDTSRNGYGCVYIGEVPIFMENEYFIEAENILAKEIQLVWKQKVASGVHVLGFQVIQN
jgi:hypothetical protein